MKEAGAMIDGPMSAPLLVPVVDRYARGWPEHAEQPCALCTRKGKRCDGPGTAEYGPFVEVFTYRFDADAHFAAYSMPSIEYRLDSGAPERAPVCMSLFVVDVEPTGHAKRTEEWDAAEADKIERAVNDGAYCYSTRGGYRLVWALAEPFIIASKQDAAAWSTSYIAALATVKALYAIDGDPTCKDWTRLYRLPYVVRDGEAQEPEATDPSTMRTWRMERIEAPAPSVKVHSLPDATEATPELIEHVRARLKAHGPAIEGQGGDQHTFVACAMLTRGYALDDDTALALLSEWNATCQPPWDEDELRTKLDNAYNYGQGDIGEARSSWETEQRIGRGLARVLSTQPEPSAPPVNRVPSMVTAPAVSGLDLLRSLVDHDPWADFCAQWEHIALAASAPDIYPALYASALDEVTAYAGSIETSTANVASERPFFMSAATLFAKRTQPPSMLIERLIMEGGIGIISGEPKSAKTWLAIECAIGVATGGTVLGKYKAKRGCAAYFFTEDMHDAITTRLGALLKGQKKDPSVVGSTFHAQPRGHHIDITRAEDCARIIASVRLIEREYGKVKLLVLDPLRNIHTRDEDKSGEMVAVFECLKMIGKLLDCTVLLVHHAKKASANSSSKRGGQKMRGSSAIHGFVDSGIYLDDVRVNDEGTLFTNAFESEVKAARSAGKFELALSVDDDPSTHTARKATWAMGKSGTTNAAPEQVRRWEDIGYELLHTLHAHKMINHAKPGRQSMGSRELLEAVRGNQGAKQIALDWLIKERLVSRTNGTYKITPAGEARDKAGQGRSSADEDDGNTEADSNAVPDGGTDHDQPG